MRRIESCQQDSLIDPFDFLGSKRKDLLETGWAGLFRNSLLVKIPVDEIKSCFHVRMGRPTKELRTMLCVLLLQQIFDLTDQDTVHQLAFNIEWHYGLNLRLEDDDSKYLCERTLRTYRSLAMDLEIDTILFRLLTDTLLDQLNVSTEKQRLDSTHIRSDMQRLCRVELFRKTIKKFLKVMRREHVRLLKRKVVPELIERYLGEKNGFFSQVKPLKAKEALRQAAEDLLVLVETFRTHHKIKGMGVFGLLQRVLNEQCEVTGGEKRRKLNSKNPRTCRPIACRIHRMRTQGTAGIAPWKAHEVQLLEIAAMARPSQQPCTESCAVYGNVHREA